MAFGSPIIQGTALSPVGIPTIGPRQAMAEVLAEYLRSITFSVWAGGLDANTSFQLTGVSPEWPDPTKALSYPTASIIELGEVDMSASSLTPRALEETLGVYDGECSNQFTPQTVLWKVAEATVDFQVDFWTSNLPDREAIEAQLPVIMSPDQARYGVLLGGHPRYYDRPVRATLISYRRPDTESDVYPNERRLQCLIRCDSDIVELRRAVLYTPSVTTSATDPNDPPQE